MRMMTPGPLASRRAQPKSHGSLDSTSESEKESRPRVCMCAPTTHAGSFRCRYHIKLRLVQQKIDAANAANMLNPVPAPTTALSVPEVKRRTVGASRLSRVTSASSLSEQESTEDHSGPLRFLKSVAGALGRHSSGAALPVSATRKSESIYEVKQGDTLSSIAREQESTVDILRAANLLRDDVMYPGVDHQLWVPLTYEVEKGDTLFLISRGFRTTIGDVMKANGMKQREAVQAGDILLLPSQ